MPRDTRHFLAELEELRKRVLVMGGVAEERVRQAMQALANRDVQGIRAIIGGDGALNRMHREIDDYCFRLLALYQPAAVDLRAVVAAVKINSDLERVGDLAVNIAEAAERYLTHPPVDPVRDLERMGVAAQQMLRGSLDAFASGHIETARVVLAQDDELDRLKNRVFKEMLRSMRAAPLTVAAAIELILMSRHLERIGDHATNIAEDIIFIVEARDVRHHADERPIGVARPRGAANPFVASEPVRRDAPIDQPQR